MKAPGVASDVASCDLQRPPAPRNVGRPDDAERPAPSRASIRLQPWRYSVKDWRSAAGIEAMAGRWSEICVYSLAAGASGRFSCALTRNRKYMTDWCDIPKFGMER